MVSIDIPAGFGYVVLLNFFGTAIMLAYLGGKVGMARKTYGISYPTMQAIVGGKVSEDQARRFNCVQRGHHNPLETISCFRFCSLISGLVYPHYTAIAGALWLVGRWSWAMGYDGAGGRYTAGAKLGGLHWLAFMYVMCASAYVGYTWL